MINLGLRGHPKVLKRNLPTTPQEAEQFKVKLKFFKKKK